jgi:hypothetical protein
LIYNSVGIVIRERMAAEQLHGLIGTFLVIKSISGVIFFIF